MKIICLLFLSVILTSFSCGKRIPPPDMIVSPGDFAKGADVSWVTQMEHEGISFYNNGKSEDLFEILKAKGMNAIRLRVWVNPPEGWCNTADLIAKAVRAKAAGMRLLIDFHYSDFWADPGKQNKPAAWQNEDINGLVAAVGTHTKEVLTALKSNEIKPEWVQVGNETNDGMLWPEGKASVHMDNFAALVNAGYDAVKSVFPAAKVIVHISNGYDNTLFRWIFDGLRNNGAKWDVIGMSLYPTSSNWQTLTAQCKTNIKDMHSRYQTPVMICEVGMNANDSLPAHDFLTTLIEQSYTVGQPNLGVFYWEPECYNHWKGYGLGAFNKAGEPTIALDAFK
jgi:arabinogalactan endo-1,4-beta-galactosidase